MQVNSSKQLLQSQFKKWKTAASQLITDHEEDVSCVIELEPSTYELCKRIASERGTTVSSVVHFMIGQHTQNRPQDSMYQTTLEQREKNPLLQLDALTKRSERAREEELN